LTEENHESAKDENPKEEFEFLSGFRLSRFRDSLNPLDGRHRRRQQWEAECDGAPRRLARQRSALLVEGERALVHVIISLVKTCPEESPAMPHDPRVMDFLMRYEEQQGRGRPITPEELCRDAPDLLDELRRAIADLEAAQELLALPATEYQPSQGRSDAPTRIDSVARQPAPPDAAPWPCVTGYQIESQLGRGGMGVVYKARQTALKRLVALKMILHGDRAEPKELARFRSEAEAVARLRHPNIVQVYEVGEHDGRPFFSMEFVEGGTLATRLRESLPDPRQAAGLVEKLARAVHAVHQCQVVHRDLKPANVLLTAEGDPKVSDFGLAKKLDDPSGLTQSGVIMGTPSYMAPEQAAGGGREVGPAADVYALGAILYECLTGRPPFRAATFWETVQQVLGDEPVPPRRLQPKLSPDLETVCLKCLAKSPLRRYRTARALAEDLRRFLAHEPTRARPAGPWERLGKWARRRPAAAALVAVAGLALLLLTALVIGGYRQVVREREQVMQEREQERQTSYVQRVALAHAEWKANEVPAALKLLDECPTDLRGWEWHYVRRLCRPELLTLRGHRGAVLSVAFRPDGRQVAAAADDGAVLIWDAATGREVRRLQGSREDAPFAKDMRQVGGWSGAGLLAYSPDGQRLALACGGVLEDGIVKVWDAATGQELLTLRGHDEAITGLAFSPDGQTLATSGADRTVRLWRAATGDAVRRFNGHADAVACVAFSPDGQHVASADRTGSILLWDRDTGNVAHTLKGHTESVQALSFSPDGRWLASAGNDGTMRVWGTATGQERQVCRGRMPRVCGVAFSPDGRRVASVGSPFMKVGGVIGYAEVNLWDTATGQALFAFRGEMVGLNGVTFSRDGRRLAAAGADGKVRVWDPEAGQDVRVFTRDGASNVSALALSADGGLLACARGPGIEGLRRIALKAAAGPAPPRGEVTIENADGTRPAVVLRGVQGRVSGVALSADGTRLATFTGRTGRSVQVWDAVTGRELTVLRGYAGGYMGVGPELLFSPGGEFLVTVETGGSPLPPGLPPGFAGELRKRDEAHRVAKVWDATTGKPLFALADPGEGVGLVRFSPDGRSLVAVGPAGGLKVWDVAAGRVIRTIADNRGEVRQAYVSVDGRFLVTGNDGGDVHVWDVSTGELTASHRGTSVALAPDGKRLALVDPAGTLGLYETATGRLERALARAPEPGPPAAPLGAVAALPEELTFSGDAKLLALVRTMGQVTVWDTATGREALASAHHLQFVSQAGFSPDGQRFVLAGARASMPPAPGPPALPRGVAVVDAIRGWDLASGKEFGGINFPQAGPGGAGPPLRAVSLDGRRVVTVSGEPPLRGMAMGDMGYAVTVWNTDSGREVLNLPSFLCLRRGVAISPDRRLLACCQSDENDPRSSVVKVWDLTTGKNIFTLPKVGRPALLFTPDGRNLVTVNDQLVTAWDTATGKRLWSRPAIGDGFQDAALSPNGSLLAVVQQKFGFSPEGQFKMEESRLSLWELATGKERLSVAGALQCVGFSPDGRRLVTAGESNTVKVWDAGSGRLLLSLSGHLKDVTRVVFSPDGRRLASASMDKTVRLWDAMTGREVFVLRGHTGDVTDVAFSGDGYRLATGGEDGVRIWDATPPNDVPEHEGNPDGP
jgi:WD40 repeat protein/tRNA A-37 threonylcarbamoyl transferase component Bud32